MRRTSSREKMQSRLSLTGLLLATACLHFVRTAKLKDGPPKNYAIQVQDSYIDEVPKFGTVIKFNIDMVNTAEGKAPYEVTISPDLCCLEIAQNDFDCDSMQLRPQKTLHLGQIDRFDNKTGSISFLFRNLYCRFRKGNCTFSISTEGKSPTTWKHTIVFNTYPPEDDEDYDQCAGLDQDPDRSCSPADCAIKYKGKRNHYNTVTGHCEPVPQCHTRAPDGVTIIAYYDTEQNLCHSLDLNSSDNTVYLSELSTANPADRELMTSLLASVDGEKVKMEDIALDVMLGAGAPLDCNHGIQKGDVCLCDPGWVSSGLDSKQHVHWCDVLDDTNHQISTGPIRLSYIQELCAIIALSVVNLLLFVGWILLVTFCLCCRKQVSC